MPSSEARTDMPAAPVCDLCRGGRLEETRVQTALWEGERLVVVEEVPALVCNGCGERFYDDETATRLDMLRGTGFPETRAARQISVPVFRLAPDEGGGG